MNPDELFTVIGRMYVELYKMQHTITELQGTVDSQRQHINQLTTTFSKGECGNLGEGNSGQ